MYNVQTDALCGSGAEESREPVPDRRAGNALADSQHNWAHSQHNVLDNVQCRRPLFKEQSLRLLVCPGDVDPLVAEFLHEVGSQRGVDVEVLVQTDREGD